MNNIDIEFYESGNDVLLILTGIGGTTKGYENKYEKLANKIMQEYNFSVVIASSPQGSWLHTEQNLEYVINFINSKRNGNFKIFAMGSSVGANILLWHSNKYLQIKKILAINPIMNINIHLLKSLQSTKQLVNVVFGEFDGSSKYSEFIPKNENVKVDILPNVDHIFTNNLDLFINLPIVYLFSKC